jgi:hypothetical protein
MNQMTTAERSKAYGRVMATLRDMGPSKLLEDEQETIRHAADTLLFTEDVLAEPGAAEAVREVEQLAARLVDADRWTPERAAQLVDDVLATGPMSTVR